jgi:hypothetical protein
VYVDDQGTRAEVTADTPCRISDEAAMFLLGYNIATNMDGNVAQVDESPNQACAVLAVTFNGEPLIIVVDDISKAIWAFTPEQEVK